MPLAYDTPPSEDTSLSRTDHSSSTTEVGPSPVGQTTPHSRLLGMRVQHDQPAGGCCCRQLIPVYKSLPSGPVLLSPEHPRESAGPQPYPSPTLIADSQEELANQVSIAWWTCDCGVG